MSSSHLFTLLDSASLWFNQLSLFVPCVPKLEHFLNLVLFYTDINQKLHNESLVYGVSNSHVVLYEHYDDKTNQKFFLLTLYFSEKCRLSIDFTKSYLKIRSKTPLYVFFFIFLFA